MGLQQALKNIAQTHQEGVRRRSLAGATESTAQYQKALERALQRLQAIEEMTGKLPDPSVQAEMLGRMQQMLGDVYRALEQMGGSLADQRRLIEAIRFPEHTLQAEPAAEHQGYTMTVKRDRNGFITGIDAVPKESV